MLVMATSLNRNLVDETPNQTLSGSTLYVSADQSLIVRQSTSSNSCCFRIFEPYLTKWMLVLDNEPSVIQLRVLSVQEKPCECPLPVLVKHPAS